MLYQIVADVTRKESQAVEDMLLYSGALCVSRNSESVDQISVTVDEQSKLRCESILKPYEFETTPLEDRDWLNEWIIHYKPVIIPDICVIAPFGFNTTDDIPVIWIDPKDTFGAGAHPTTKIALSMIRRAMSEKGEIRSVIDIGTGSGVLAIAAEKFGAESVVATDIDEKAILRSEANAKGNFCERIIFRNESLSCNSPHDEFDLVVANIPIAILEDNFRHISRYARTGGSLIVTGMSSIWRSRMNDILSDDGFEIIDSAELDDWICFRASRIK
jgi:ribosomal protein L11 methyltransferase